MANYDVTWWETIDGKENKKNSICFSSLSSADNGITSIRYLANIDKRLTNEEIDFYLDFITKTFTGRDWSFKKIENGKKIENIEYILKTDNWNKNNVLVYLSAFRLVDEGYEIINGLFKNRAENFDTQFYKFQEIHKDISDDKITLSKNGNYTLSCHGLMHFGPYGGTCRSENFNPIKLEALQKRLKEMSSDKVHGYFSPTEHKVAAPKVEQVIKPANPINPVKPVAPLEIKPKKPVDKLIKNDNIFA
jgi:hypothetical protein